MCEFLNEISPLVKVAMTVSIASAVALLLFGLWRKAVPKSIGVPVLIALSCSLVLIIQRLAGC